jgi:hypothetical protein
MIVVPIQGCMPCSQGQTWIFQLGKTNNHYLLPHQNLTFLYLTFRTYLKRAIIPSLLARSNVNGNTGFVPRESLLNLHLQKWTTADGSDISCQLRQRRRRQCWSRIFVHSGYNTKRRAQHQGLNRPTSK